MTLSSSMGWRGMPLMGLPSWSSGKLLAAGMILMSGWHGECDLIDPMCGSGTIPIEAALIARNIAPGVFRKEFAFEKWIDFDQDLFNNTSGLLMRTDGRLSYASRK